MMRLWKLGVVGTLTLSFTQAVLAQGAGGAGAAGQGGAGTGTPGQAGNTGPGGYSQTPWFSNQGVRNQLKLQPEQFQKLEKSYMDYYGKYKSSLGSLDKLNEQERTQKLNDLSSSFGSNVMKSAEGTLTPEQMQRFRQLDIQYRGYDALNDPDIQRKLKLTDEQREQLRKYGRQYNEQMNSIYKDNNREAATKRYNDLRRQSSDRINSTLTEEQRRAWRDITGDPYNFEPTFEQSNNKSGGGSRDRR